MCGCNKKNVAIANQQRLQQQRRRQQMQLQQQQNTTTEITETNNATPIIKKQGWRKKVAMLNPRMQYLMRMRMRNNFI